MFVVYKMWINSLEYSAAMESKHAEALKKHEKKEAKRQRKADKKAKKKNAEEDEIEAAAAAAAAAAADKARKEVTEAIKKRKLEAERTQTPDQVNEKRNRML